MDEHMSKRKTPTGLKTNSRVDPLGIDALPPLFQWQVYTQQENCYQSAYRIIATESGGGTVWDSGKVLSDKQIQIPYDGDALHPMTRYCWRVMIWDQNDVPSEWSEEAAFETGLFHSEDWNAVWIGSNSDFDSLSGLHWIGCNHMEAGQSADFCCTFILEESLQQAVFDGTAFACWELFCNGVLYRRMNTDWKQDGTSPIRYADLTEYLNVGKNTICLRVTADRRGRIAAIGKLLLRFEDGKEIQIQTDADWTVQSEPAQIIGSYGDAPWGNLRRRYPAPLLRKEFALNGTVSRARLYASGLGYGVYTINGQPVTDAVLQTEYSQYHKTVYYHTFDVTELLHDGENCIGAELGRGYYSFHKDWVGLMAEQDEPKLLLELKIWMADGRCEHVVSGADWKTTDGPTVDDSIWYGDKYDARLLPHGWDLLGFDDRAWKPVRVMRAPGGKLRAAELPPIRITETLQPVSYTHLTLPTT